MNRESAYSITVLPSGLKFPARPDQTLLGAMIEAGVSVLEHGCKKGNCGRCKIRVLSGEYRHEELNSVHISGIEEIDGISLACCSFAEGDLSITQEL
ncbi:MAG: 2Fe-2S iron-sulfur cluster-binding protein [bacterium]|nr:2Fe-2S iron-sulfur cluster-binding protein [bacterium]